jgi:hypothetical protein
MFTFDPARAQQIVSVLAAVTAGGVSLFLATWMVLQALKKEIPGLRRYMVRAVLGIAALLVITYLVLPILFIALVATLLVAALILGADATIKRMTGGGNPPDKPAV